MNVQVLYSILTEEVGLRVIHVFRIDVHDLQIISFKTNKAQGNRSTVCISSIKDIAFLSFTYLFFEIRFCYVSLTGWCCVPQADFRLDK